MVQVTVDKRDDVIIICPIGEITALRKVSELNSTLDDYLDDGYRKIIFHMKDVLHIDSSGLGIFFGMYKKTQKAGATIVIAEASDRLDKVFKIMKFQTIVKFTETLDDAIKIVSQIENGT